MYAPFAVPRALERLRSVNRVFHGGVRACQSMIIIINNNTIYIQFYSHNHAKANHKAGLTSIVVKTDNEGLPDISVHG